MESILDGIVPEVIERVARAKGLDCVYGFCLDEESGFFSFDGFNDRETVYCGGMLRAEDRVTECFHELGERKFPFIWVNRTEYMTIRVARECGFSLKEVASVLYGPDGIAMEDSTQRDYKLNHNNSYKRF